jgi:hypothetical protein
VSDVDYFSWAEEETPPPLTDDDAPPLVDDPSQDIDPWVLTDSERRIYEAGYINGHSDRDPEIAQLNHEADRLYQAAFDHRNCACWKGRHHTQNGKAS